MAALLLHALQLHVPLCGRWRSDEDNFLGQLTMGPIWASGGRWGNCPRCCEKLRGHVWCAGLHRHELHIYSFINFCCSRCSQEILLSTIHGPRIFTRLTTHFVYDSHWLHESSSLCMVFQSVKLTLTCWFSETVAIFGLNSDFESSFVRFCMCRLRK